MDISRNFALEIFKLQEGKYTEKDLSTAYHRLAIATHHDGCGKTVSFRFIQECKKVLEKKTFKSSIVQQIR